MWEPHRDKPRARGGGGGARPPGFVTTNVVNASEGITSHIM